MAKRAWSREFTPRGEKLVHLHISNVPPTLRQRFAAKCKREGKSQRNLLLGWIRNWVDGRRPDQDKVALGRANDRTAMVAVANGRE